jgi:hypothetical protein
MAGQRGGKRTPHTPKKKKKKSQAEEGGGVSVNLGVVPGRRQVSAVHVLDHLALAVELDLGKVGVHI